MPRVTDQEPDVEISLSPSSEQPQRPLFQVKVVYLGSKRNKTVPLKGRIDVETLGEGVDKVETRSAGGSGFTTYDFTTHDQRGRPLPKELFMPANHLDPTVRGKRFRIVEHPDHLWAFQAEPALREPSGKDGEPVFKLLGPKEQMTDLNEYFKARARALRRTDQDYGLISRS